jgi:RNA polymerase sigma-70 factor (ECF subfamily)
MFIEGARNNPYSSKIPPTHYHTTHTNSDSLCFPHKILITKTWILLWMTNEEELIKAALQGDEDAFERLLYPYRNNMLNLSYRMLGNLEDAKEVCQEAVLKIFRYLKRYKKGKSFKNWIYKIVVNASNDFLRKKRKHQDILAMKKNVIDDLSANPETQFLNKEVGEKIAHCLEGLSPKEKTVFLLRDVEGLSVREAAGVLGASSVSVRTHLSRARQKLRNQLEKLFPDGPLENER